MESLGREKRENFLSVYINFSIFFELVMQDFLIFFLKMKIHMFCFQHAYIRPAAAAVLTWEQEFFFVISVSVLPTTQIYRVGEGVRLSRICSVEM